MVRYAERVKLVHLLLPIASSMLTSAVHAQDTGFSCDVQLADLTVDDRPPPASYGDIIRNGIRPTIDPIIACYRARLAERPGLSGEVRLRLWVSAREVIRATQESSTLVDPALEECARQEIYRFRLPNEAPTGGARVRFALRFTTTGRPAPLPTAPATIVVPTPEPAAPIASPPPRATIRVDRIRGALDGEAFSRVILPTAFDACPVGVGDVELHVTARRDGRLSTRQGRRSVRDRALVRCIVEAVRAQSAPALATATRATITITLHR